MADEAQKQTAVYVAWSTFNNVLNSFAQGIPNVVDKSAFPGQSGGVQSQLLVGMKFLGLIEENGAPTPTLAGLAVADEGARKEKLKALLKERYSALFALDLEKATPDQVNKTMADSYNVSGDTKEKAIRFFMSAVDYAGIPVSRFLRPKPGNGNGTAPPARRRRASGPRAKGEFNEADPPPAPPAAPASGTSKTVALKSGGTLTLSVSMDPFTLSQTDRDFIFGLIDNLTKYDGKGS